MQPESCHAERETQVMQNYWILMRSRSQAKTLFYANECPQLGSKMKCLAIAARCMATKQQKCKYVAFPNLSLRLTDYSPNKA
jgi:hypothetical protein